MKKLFLVKIQKLIDQVIVNKLIKITKKFLKIQIQIKRFLKNPRKQNKKQKTQPIPKISIQNQPKPEKFKTKQ